MSENKLVLIGLVEPQADMVRDMLSAVELDPAEDRAACDDA